MRGMPMCYLCAHYGGRQTVKCQAFPGGIPEEIFFRGADHRQPWPDDSGIMFTPMKGKEEEAEQFMEERQEEGSDGDPVVEGVDE